MARQKNHKVWHPSFVSPLIVLRSKIRARTLENWPSGVRAVKLTSPFDSAYKSVHNIEENNESGNQEKTCFGLFACQRKWVWVLTGCILIVVLVSVSIIGILLRPSRQATQTPRQPQAIYTPSQPQAICTRTTCQSLLLTIPKCHRRSSNCQSRRFKKLIKEYLIDPSTSPHGSDINCWDVCLR